MEERRKGVCAYHQDLADALGRIEEKLEVMAERQVTYIAKTERIEAIVTNGLSQNVQSIKRQLDTFCEEVRKRLDVLDSFSWFRNWMNSVRDDLFKNIVKLAFIGGVVYLAYHFGDKIIGLLLKGQG